MSTADNAPRWRKSSRSSNGANCVEVAFAREDVLARDSKDRGGLSLAFPQAGWTAFLDSVKANR